MDKELFSRKCYVIMHRVVNAYVTFHHLKYLVPSAYTKYYNNTKV